jgi:anti-repressor protein
MYYSDEIKDRAYVLKKAGKTIKKIRSILVQEYNLNKHPSFGSVSLWVNKNKGKIYKKPEVVDNTQLVKFETKNNNILVNARDLHKSLKLKKDFSDWIKYQIESLGLIENFDYTPQKCGVKTEIILTSDTAKHIAMASRTDKGKAIRIYFIEAEKKLRKMQTPQSFAEALQLAANQQLELERQQKVINVQNKAIETIKETLEETDKNLKSLEQLILKSDGEWSIGEFQKTACIKFPDGKDVTYSQMYHLFRLNKFTSNSKRHKNIPLASEVNSHRMILSPYICKEGKERKPTGIITPTGFVWYFKFFLRKGFTSSKNPVIEGTQQTRLDFNEQKEYLDFLN